MISEQFHSNFRAIMHPISDWTRIKSIQWLIIELKNDYYIIGMNWKNKKGWIGQVRIAVIICCCTSRPLKRPSLEDRHLLWKDVIVQSIATIEPDYTPSRQQCLSYRKWWYKSQIKMPLRRQWTAPTHYTTNVTFTII